MSSNGTQRPNSTYDGPNIEQTIFKTEIFYNMTYPDEGQFQGVSGAQVWQRFILRS